MRGPYKRPMTARRIAVLSAYADEAAQGKAPTLARLARRCGLYDYREARRTLNDLRAMGAI